MYFTKSEKIYLKAEFYNWDNGLQFLKKLLLDKDCDKATALLIYWRSDPKFYYGYDSESEIPDWSTEGYQLMKAVEQLLLKDEFPEKISYEPDADRIPKDVNILNKIPQKLLLPSVGERDSTVLVNQYYYGKLLIEACENGNWERAEQLISKRPDCIDVCVDGRTPILVSIDKVKVFEYLLSKGADVHNTGDENGELEPIHTAAVFGKNTVLKVLLKHGININTQTADSKRTPLHAILNSDSQYKWNRYKLLTTLKFLLKNGADVNMKDIDGKTPLDLAIANKLETAVSVLESHSA